MLKSDGTAVAVGDNHDGQCDIPTLPDCVTYVQLACGRWHSVLIRSDGAAVAWGCNEYGCCDIPALIDGVSYTHVASIGDAHTVLLTSDGNAVVCGWNQCGQCNIPVLPPGITYEHRGAQIVLTLFFCESYAAFCLLSGKALCQVDILDSDMLIDIWRAFKGKMMNDYGKYRVVLPDGEFLSVVCAQAPTTRIEPFLIRKRARRN